MHSNEISDYRAYDFKLSMPATKAFLGFLQHQFHTLSKRLSKEALEVTNASDEKLELLIEKRRFLTDFFSIAAPLNDATFATQHFQFELSGTRAKMLEELFSEEEEHLVERLYFLSVTARKKTSSTELQQTQSAITDIKEQLETLSSIRSNIFEAEKRHFRRKI